jgi:hypothetical protein
MKVYGILVEGVPLCALCNDPNAGRPATRAFMNTLEDCNGYRTTHIGIEPACHPDVGSDAEYCKAHGTFTLVCHECHVLLTTFKVAAK